MADPGSDTNGGGERSRKRKKKGSVALLVPELICPKCGHPQSGGEECLNCGVIFAKIVHGRPGSPSEARHEYPAEAPDRAKPLARVFRWGRWLVLLAAVTALFLLMRPAPLPEIEWDARTARSTQLKIRQFHDSVRKGRPDSLQMDQPELNAWIDSHLLLQPTDDAELSPAAESSSPKPREARQPLTDSYQAVHTSIHTVRMQLIEDRIRSHIAFELYGKMMTFELEGRLSVRNGYLRLEPVSGKLGLLPLPAATLRTAVNRMLESPENRQKFRVPDYIQALRVQQGRLHIVTQGR